MWSSVESGRGTDYTSANHNLSSIPNRGGCEVKVTALHHVTTETHDEEPRGLWQIEEE